MGRRDDSRRHFFFFFSFSCLFTGSAGPLLLLERSRSCLSGGRSPSVGRGLLSLQTVRSSSCSVESALRLPGF